MCQLQLSLFGAPVVKHGETTLTFSTRKAQALLVYLAVEGGLHTRKALSEAFWPELDAKHGRAALRATLLELRRLFDHSHDASEQAHLCIERDTLGIEQDGSLVLDLRLVEAVSKRVKRGVESLTGQASEELLRQLEQAALLVRGPFLAGFTLRDSQFFDDWSTQHREYWHRRVSQVFDALSSLYEQGGEVERAIESVTGWLGFDPLNEEGYRRLMRLRFAQGDRVGALRAYSRCRTVLADELQAEPEPETVALAKRMRHTAPPRPLQAPSPQASAGQPLYLVETLKGLLEQEVIVPSLQSNGTWRLVLRFELLAQAPTSPLIPTSVRELICSQLRQLPPAVWSLLVAGAVLGEGLTFKRLCQVIQLGEETGLLALEEVLRRGWLCEGRGAEELQTEAGYIFLGEVVRAVVFFVSVL